MRITNSAAHIEELQAALDNLKMQIIGELERFKIYSFSMMKERNIEEKTAATIIAIKAKEMREKMAERYKAIEDTLCILSQQPLKHDNTFPLFLTYIFKNIMDYFFTSFFFVLFAHIYSSFLYCYLVIFNIASMPFLNCCERVCLRILPPVGVLCVGIWGAVGVGTLFGAVLFFFIFLFNI